MRELNKSTICRKGDIRETQLPITPVCRAVLCICVHLFDEVNGFGFVSSSQAVWMFFIVLWVKGTLSLAGSGT